MADLTKEDIRSVIEIIKELYLEDMIPWICGYSGGKDSTAVVQLVWYALQELPNSAVVDPQKLVGCSGHVDIVVLALPPFTVKELEYRVVSGCVLDDRRHDLKKRFAQSGRPTLRNMPVLRFKSTGLAGRRIHADKGY